MQGEYSMEMLRKCLVNCRHKHNLSVSLSVEGGMSSRLRPQKFGLSLEKSKHPERCAECVTQPTRMLARHTAAVARTLKGPAWHKTPRHGRYAEHFNGEPVRGGAVPHRSDTLGRYRVAGIWFLHQIPIYPGPMGDGLAI